MTTDPTDQTSLTRKLDAILDRPILNGAVVSVVVLRPDGTQVFGRNPDMRTMPASNQKILSVAYALHTLGPDWRPKTRIWKESDRLVVDCPGDPSMTYAKLKEAAAKLNWKGPVFVRQGYRPGVPPTWENDDLPHRYAPRITALTVNTASFTLVNDNGVPKLEPEPFGVRILHRPYNPAENIFDPFGNLLIVKGILPKERRNLENFAIPEPDAAAAGVLGGPLIGTATIPTRPPDLEIVGDSIGQMAKACLQPSDNYLAECLMMLAAQKEGPLGETPYPRAPNRMREFLVKTVGLSRDEVRPMDGSGMSRHNLVTARGIAKVLGWALELPWADLWLDAMARPGVGTLSSRLQGSSFVGKTGSLNSVVGLSGVVTAPNGEKLRVGMMLNHFIGTAAEARQCADDFIRELEKPASLSRDQVSVGAFVEERYLHEGVSALPQHRPLDGHRISRPVLHRLAARPRHDRRAESAYASAHRAQ